MADIDPKLLARYILKYSAQEDNIIKYQLETKQELEEFKNNVLGNEFDATQNKYIKCPYKDQLMNDKGAYALIGLLRPDVSKMVSLSDFDDEEINHMGLEDLNEFTYFLVRHKDDYGFKSLQTISVILGRINKLNYSTMKKARDAGERDTIRKQFTHVESEESIKDMRKDAKLFGGLLNRQDGG